VWIGVIDVYLLILGLQVLCICIFEFLLHRLSDVSLVSPGLCLQLFLRTSVKISAN
jgi:hypothetical protein